MRKWIKLIEEVVSHKQYDLAAKFDHFNKLCFDGSLPKIPVRWGSLKRAIGICKQKFFVPPQHRHLPLRIRARYGQSIPDGAQIVLDRKYVREEREIDAILVHEMIHAWFYYANDLGENHGTKFMAKLKECERITGLNIPITEEVKDLELSDDVALNKPFVVMIVERGNDLLYAMMSPSVYQRIAPTAPEMMRRLMRGSTVTLYGTSSEAWNKKALSAKLQRPKSFPKTTLYYLKTPELLADLKASGKVLFSGQSSDLTQSK